MIATTENWLSDCNWIRTQNYVVLKRTLGHLAKLARIGCLNNKIIKAIKFDRNF